MDILKTHFRAALAVASCVFVACGSSGDAPGPDSGDVALRPTETFQWGGQPIAFAIPPAGWEREITNQGGLLGASFIKAGSVGEVISISEYMALDKRDRCDEFQELLADFDELDDRGFRKGVQHARLYPSPPLNGDEELVAEQANETLNRAVQAYFRSDRGEAQREIEIAQVQATRVHYSLDEVVDRVLYDPQGFPPYIKVDVGRPERAEFQGEPAVRQQYTLVDSGKEFAGRRLYFIHNNRLFVAGFQGLEENVALFEQVVATIEFPPGDCEH